jgi:hypothetical protein
MTLRELRAQVLRELLVLRLGGAARRGLACLGRVRRMCRESRMYRPNASDSSSRSRRSRASARSIRSKRRRSSAESSSLSRYLRSASSMMVRSEMPLAAQYLVRRVRSSTDRRVPTRIRRTLLVDMTDSDRLRVFASDKHRRTAEKVFTDRGACRAHGSPSGLGHRARPQPACPPRREARSTPVQLRSARRR